MIGSGWILAAGWQFSALGLPSRLVHPEALWFLLGVAVAAVLWGRSLILRRRALRALAADRHLSRMAPRAGLGRDVAGGLPLLAGLVLLTVAAAQPQCGTHTVLSKRYGIDLVIAMDASLGMEARDVKPSRLARAKLEMAGLIDRLQGDRVAVVVFARDAFVQSPLTTDYSAAKLFLRAIDSRQMPRQGTSMAEALRVSRELLQAGDRGASGRAVVLITDGEDHEGGVEAEVQRLADEGVRVFVVAIGSKTGEPVPLLDPSGAVVGYKKDRAGRTVMTRLDEELLRNIAEKTGGRYVHSSAGDLGVGEVWQELDRMDKSEFESRVTVQFDDRFPLFAWPGLILFALGLVIGEGRWRRRMEAGR